jgi:hypothetical protein
MGDAGVGHVAHNNGVEGNRPSFISAVCGSAGKNKWMKIDVFVGNMLKYVADQSKEKALAQMHNYGTHRFLIHPEMSLQQWQSIQLLDIRMLQHAYIYGSEDKRRRWRRWFDTLADIEGPQRRPPGGALLTQQIQIFHDKHTLPEINRMEIENIVVLSMLLLRALDLEGQLEHRTAQLFSDKVDHMKRLYYDLVVDPATVVDKHSGITITDMVALLESFHLLQPVRGEGRWKCNCKEFFRDGICTHATLFTMLWYPDCQVPISMDRALQRRTQRQPTPRGRRPR